MNKFNIEIANSDPIVLELVDDTCLVRISEFDFSALDNDYSTTYSFNISIVKQTKTTNFQLKKKIKRTIKQFMNDAIENTIREHAQNGK